MKNNRKSIFIAVVFAVFIVAFFCPRITKAFEDNTSPEITSLSITPSEIDTSSGNQTITATIAISDSGVGMCSAELGDSTCESSVYLNKSYISIRLEPLIGTQYVSAYSPSYAVDFHKISGDDNNGVYRATMTIPYGSKSGIWAVTSVWVQDKLGNGKQWNAVNGNDISSIPNASGLTIANTATSTSVKIEKEWTLSSSNVSATFPADTIVTKKDGGSLSFYQMVNQDFSIGDVTNNGLDSTDISNIAGKIKIGIPGLNLSFSKSVTLEFNIGSQYDGQTLKIQTLEENGGSWANETTCTVSGGKCSFTVNHASYFAAIKTTANSTSSGTVSGSQSGNIVIGTDMPTLGYSSSKKAKKKINLTFNNLRLTKKKWVKIRLNGRKVTVQRVKRIGNDSTVRIYFKYRKWAVGNYNLSMTYKNQIKVPYTTKKGKTKYRKGWESGSVNSENILSIN